MIDVAQWLESLGLGAYRERFQENAIDGSVLRDLTDDDLKELGVLVGHRRKMLRAIEEIRHAEALEPEPTRRTSKGEDGERRQLSVLFCDLVGSTALATELDPEDMREVMESYHRCLTDLIASYGGVVAEYSGDGALAYFGYPVAHEDDTAQAIRAALAITDAVAKLETKLGSSLETRVGIATGTVVVSDLLENPSRKQAVVGETPNLAARLQTLAEPGRVVICANTRSLAEGLFDYQELGPKLVKGLAAPVASWQVIGPSGVVSRFEARHGSRLAPLLGRDEEVELLMRRWRSASQGGGRVVLVSGEPGIGKSHVAQTLQERLIGEDHARLQVFCSAHHSNSVLFPFTNHLERAAGIHRRDLPDEKLAKLRSVLDVSSPGSEDVVELLANLLMFPVADSGRLKDMSPQRRKKRTLEVLMGQLEAIAARKPVLMICEDVHWIDPTSLEFLGMLVERAAELPLLLLITARPEFQLPWPPHAHVSTLSLTRLSRADGAALAKHVAGGRALPENLINEIWRRTDGVPLFVEELTKTVLERGLLEERPGKYVLHEPMLQLAIPSTLQASLMERLDRLGAVREIAQIGSVAGREFSYELLQVVAGQTASHLETALQALVDAELVFRRGMSRQALYVFKHTLVRDAAYGSLLNSRRVQLHAAIADALEKQFPEVVAAEPETVAHHLAEAGLSRRAVRYWLQAGSNAARRSANVEAIAHLRRGTEAVAALPEEAARNQLELDLLMALAPCLIATQGPASLESLETFARARHLCELIGEAPEYPKVMFWAATAEVVRGDLQRALIVTEAVLDDALARNDLPALLNATRGQAMIHLFTGRIADADKAMQRALKTFTAASESDRLAARSAGQDAGAACLAQMSWVLWLMGCSDSAVDRARLALERAKATAHPHTEAYACYYASVLHSLRGEPALADRFATRCLTLCEEHGFRQWLALSRAVRGINASMVQPSSAALEDVASALEEYCGSGYRLGITVLYAMQCRALLLVERHGAALETISKGLAMADQNGERFFEAELLRLKAKAVQATGESREDARSWLERALAVARAQGSRMLELRAARDRAALDIADGRREDAMALLAPLVASFTEGEGTEDLQSARALVRAT